MPDAAAVPTLADVIREHIDARLGTLETALPARVIAYDPVEQRVIVQPLITGCYVDAVTRKRTAYTLPQIAGVPVAFPQAAGFSIVWPLSPGDRVLLVFASRDISGWLATDGPRNEPTDPRRHDLTDAIAIPGLASFANPIPATGYAAGALVIHGADIRLGSSAAVSPVSLAVPDDANWTALSGVFASWVPLATDGGAALKALLVALIGTGWPASVAAAKVKAE